MTVTFDDVEITEIMFLKDLKTKERMDYLRNKVFLTNLEDHELAELYYQYYVVNRDIRSYYNQ